MRKSLLLTISICFHLFFQQASASQILTNAAKFENPPQWLKEEQVEKVISDIQKYLEWDIRQVNVVWYDQQAAFQNFHHYDGSVLAVSKFAASKTEKDTIHIGPRVEAKNFKAVFGHELVHVILNQKFGKSIPKWLEEGFANYIAKQGSVDYKWLSTQNIGEVRNLVHPFINGGSASPRYHYQASTALVEMLAKRCPDGLNDLLQLSVGQSLEGYLSTTCEISDINAEFKKWVQSKSK